MGVYQITVCHVTSYDYLVNAESEEDARRMKFNVIRQTGSTSIDGHVIEVEEIV